MTTEIGYPLLSYGAIVDLEHHVRPHFNIMEFGSGGSTVFFSRRCATLKSFETDAVWVEKVRSILPVPSNVTLIHGTDQENNDAIKFEPNEYYDLVLVDSVHPYQFRYKHMVESSSKIKRGGLLVVDNYDDRYIRKFDYSPWDVYTYDQIGYRNRGTRICVKR
jgi:predicted O-methyltransferase YrrM